MKKIFQIMLVLLLFIEASIAQTKFTASKLKVLNPDGTFERSSKIIPLLITVNDDNLIVEESKLDLKAEFKRLHDEKGGYKTLSLYFMDTAIDKAYINYYKNEIYQIVIIDLEGTTFIYFSDVLRT